MQKSEIRGGEAVVRPFLRRPVEKVGIEGRTDVRHVYAELVRAPGERSEGDERVPLAVFCEGGIERARRLPVLSDDAAKRVFTLSRDRGVDFAFGREGCVGMAIGFFTTRRSSSSYTRESGRGIGSMFSLFPSGRTICKRSPVRRAAVVKTGIPSRTIPPYFTRRIREEEKPRRLRKSPTDRPFSPSSTRRFSVSVSTPPFVRSYHIFSRLSTVLFLSPLQNAKSYDIIGEQNRKIHGKGRDPQKRSQRKQQ